MAHSSVKPDVKQPDVEKLITVGLVSSVATLIVAWAVVWFVGAAVSPKRVIELLIYAMAPLMFLVGGSFSFRNHSPIRGVLQIVAACVIVASLIWQMLT